jgi:hypothetical protein
MSTSSSPKCPQKITQSRVDERVCQLMGAKKKRCCFWAVQTLELEKQDNLDAKKTNEDERRRNFFFAHSCCESGIHTTC